MKALCVRDALSDRVIRVSYGERPVDVRAKIAEKRATHAVVFQDDKIRGVVLLGAIGLWKAERPFGDLLPELPVRIVPEHAQIDEAGQLIDRDDSDVLVVTAPDGRFRGIVTQPSLLRALLRQSETRTTEEIAAAEERFRGLLESAPDAMLITDCDGRIVNANSQAARMFRYELS